MMQIEQRRPPRCPHPEVWHFGGERELVRSEEQRNDGAADDHANEHNGNQASVKHEEIAELVAERVGDRLREHRLLEDGAQEDHGGEHKIADGAKQVVICR